MANEREQRGLMIAATCGGIKCKDGAWLVPSQSQDGTRYTVNASEGSPSCNCPDFEIRGQPCKHIYAARFVLQRRNERNRDGSITTTETMTLTVEKKTTYPQDWSAYNAAQSVEKDRFQVLLADLCRNVAEPERNVRGQRPHTLRDALFAMTFKVYSTFSSRRFSSDLREAFARGHTSKPIPGLKVVQFFEDEKYTPLLKMLIAESAKPLKAVETKFAIDSSGFGSSRFDRWFDEKHGVPRRQAVWVKAHIATGVKTNVVTAVRIFDKDSADCPQFGPLTVETAKSGFTIAEMSADKAYGSYENFELAAGFGAEAFIAFKSNTTGAQGGEFARMFHYFQYRKEEFLSHYHQRSNVESTFSMIKRKFGGEVRSKTDVAMVNEVLCKVLAHNLCVVIQEQHELGIEAEFWKDQPGHVRALMN